MFGLQHFCARHLKRNLHTARMPCSAHYLTHLPWHPHSISTSSCVLFPSNWTPTASLLFDRFVKQSPLSGYESNAPIEMSSEARLIVLHSRRCSFKSASDDFATTIDVLAMCEPEIDQTRSTPSYQNLKTTVRRHIDQTIRTRNFRVRKEW